MLRKAKGMIILKDYLMQGRQEGDREPYKENIWN